MKKSVYIILLLVFAGIAGFAGYKLFSGLLTYKRGDDLYSALKESAVALKTEGNEDGDAPQASGAHEEDPSVCYVSEHEIQGEITHLHADLEYVIWPRYAVDFDVLKDISEDVCGWIRIEGTHIDYPVAQHTDNEFYIRHGIDGEAINTGSIFVDYRIRHPFEKENTVIYGHNQRNSAMFHDLVLYEDETYAKEHEYVIIYLPDGRELTYRVFAAYQTPADGKTYSMAFASKDSFYSYLLEMQSLSLVDFGVSLSAEDKIITLSTCTNDGDNNRMVVQAKLISTR